MRGQAGAVPERAEPGFDAVLTDGSTVHVRPLGPDDGDRLVTFHGRLSPETIHLRFFSPHPRLSEREVEHFTHLDGIDRAALVATLDDEIIAVVRYDRTPDTDDAEVALVVDDPHQGRGVATLLLEHLAALARATGIRRFVAETLAHNGRMLGVFRDAGFTIQSSFEQGVVHVSFPIRPDESFLEAMEARERRADVASLQAILRPRSIAVAGAGRSRGGIGHEILRNLLLGNFNGPIYPVNRNAPHIAGVRAYPSVAELPEPVDLVVVCVPAPEVAAVVKDCGRLGVGGLVVITAGFAEAGGSGVEAERELAHVAHRHGMRVVGPNCMGVVNTAEDVRMNATFAPVAPTRGRLAFLSQSGALGIAILQHTAQLGLGVSTFVSVGNKADVSGNDMLLFWEEDPDTDVILLYLESFGNPRKFARIARRISRTKPIVAVKSGRSTAGVRAAGSHTAAAATPEAAVEALFHQAGVIRVDTLGELFDVAQVLGSQPLPPGKRVAIVGNSGGPGILAADACEAAGLEVPELSSSTQEALRAFLPAEAAVRNPVDLIASASADAYERALRVVLADPAVDALLVVFTPPLVTEAVDVGAAVGRVAEDAGPKPIVANFLAMASQPEVMASRGTLPSFPFPEEAVRALGRAAAYAAWRRNDLGTVPELPDIDIEGGAAAVRKVLADRPDGRWLNAADAAALVAHFGIPALPLAVAHTVEEAVAAADRLGYPVALKAAAGDIVHKTDVGAVRLNLATPEEARAAFTSMADALGPDMGGAVVQPMASPGVETIVGIAQDPSFGPLVMFGLGGVATDLLGDRGFRLVPITDSDAAELVLSVRAAPLLSGYRGAPPTDVGALKDLIVRVGRLADELPEVAEMDLNPVIVSPSGVVAVDVKVRVAPVSSPAEPYLRRLR
ncbi:MAG: CoA-binding domain protein [Acidimicrobiales bacterium]|nr:CoA-binding domain protein [Acidimicrobiales bacterium]